MLLWHELVGIASSLQLSSEPDAMIWQYEAKGTYSCSTHYAILNFGGIKPVCIPAVWKLHIPPRVHIFLWLLAHNKLMTRDNLKKRNMDKPENCMFCSHNESVHRPLFDCIVAKQIWQEISLFFGVDVGHDFTSTAKYWLANSRHAV